MQEIELIVLMKEGNYIYGQYNHVDNKLPLQIIGNNHPNVIDDLPFPEGIVSLEEMAGWVHSQVDRYEEIYVEVTFPKRQLPLEEMRPKGERERDLQLQYVEDQQKEKIPIDGERGKRVDVKPEAQSLVLPRVHVPRLLVQQLVDVLLNVGVYRIEIDSFVCPSQLDQL